MRRLRLKKDNALKVYCGSVGGIKALTYMWEKDYGIMLNPISWKYSQGGAMDWRYWALDNGAYKAYTDNTEFDEDRFLKTVYEKVPKSDMKPDFIVVPDIVGGGKESLGFSLHWYNRLRGLSKYNWYLAVQDGMEIDEVEKVIDKFGGIFVGGTVKWKVKTGEEWVKLAHAHNLPCHIGRVGVFRRIIWARRINADSIDSTSFIWKPNGFEILDSAKAQTLLEIIQ